MGLSFFSVRVYLGCSGFVQPFLIPESVKGLEKKFILLTLSPVLLFVFLCFSVFSKRPASRNSQSL